MNFSYAAGVLRFYDIKNGTLVHRKDAVVKPMNFKVKTMTINCRMVLASWMRQFPTTTFMPYILEKKKILMPLCLLLVMSINTIIKAI